MNEQEMRDMADLRAKCARLESERDYERARVAPLNKAAETLAVRLTQAQQDVRVAKSVAAAAAAPAQNPPRTKHNATCLRCGGPAYQGLGLPVCERDGGCTADRQPVVFAMMDKRPGVAIDIEERAYSHKRETAWYLPALGVGPIATREQAIVIWREWVAKGGAQ